jgi:hypothetical protein
LRLVPFAGISIALLAMAFACDSFDDAIDKAEPDASVADGAGTSDDAASDASDASQASDAAMTRSEAYRAAVLADEPLVYWRMGRVVSAGLVVPDETANQNDLLLNDPSDFTVDASGIFTDDPAIRFGGKTSYALATDSGALAFDGLAPFTIECWARRELDEAGDAGSFLQHLVSYVDGNSNEGTMSGYLLYFRFGENTFFEHGSLDAGAGTQVGGPLAAFDTWAHYAAVFDGTDVALFINGQQKNKLPVRGPLAARVSPFTIAKASNETARNFQGSMDEIAVYAKLLPTKTLIARYALGSGQ